MDTGERNTENAKQCLLSADHWETLASREKAQAEWDKTHGFNAGPLESSPGYNKARLYLRTAESLRLEAATGEPHCVDHLKPRRRCGQCNPSQEIP